MAMPKGENLPVEGASKRRVDMDLEAHTHKASQSDLLLWLQWILWGQWRPHDLCSCCGKAASAFRRPRP